MGKSLIYYAKQSNFYGVTQALALGATPDVRDRSGNTPLMWAAKRGCMSVCQLLLQHGADANLSNIWGQTALVFAVRRDDRDMVNLLLHSGASPTAERMNVQPLFLAVSFAPKLIPVLLHAGVDIETRHPFNNLTPLGAAMRFGYDDACSALLEHGADFRVADHRGRRPLDDAMRYGHANIVRMLVLRHLLTDSDLRRVFVWALQTGQLGLLALLENVEHVLSLHLAAQKNCTEAAKLLLERGFDVNGLNKTNATPLHIAARNGKTRTARLLIDRGANVKAKDINSTTPLHEAAYYGHVKTARLLLDRGADVNACDEWGNTPLNVSKTRGWVIMSAYLFRRGGRRGAGSNPHARAAEPDQIRIEICDEQATPQAVKKSAKDGGTPRDTVTKSADTQKVVLSDAAREARRAQAAARSEAKRINEAMVEAVRHGRYEETCQLLGKGANVDYQSRQGTAFHALILVKNCEQFVKLLQAHGGDIDMRDSTQRTALHLAAEYGQTDVLHVLLKGGADINARDQALCTPLYRACMSGRAAVVEALLNASADVSIVDEFERTALHAAANNGHCSIVEQLLLHEADPGRRDADGKTPLDLARTRGKSLVVKVLRAADA